MATGPIEQKKHVFVSHYAGHAALTWVSGTHRRCLPNHNLPATGRIAIEKQALSHLHNG